MTLQTAICCATDGSDDQQALAKSGLSNMRPNFAKNNPRNQGLIDVVLGSQGSLRGPSGFPRTNLSHCLLRQFCGVILYSPRTSFGMKSGALPVTARQAFRMKTGGIRLTHEKLLRVNTRPVLVAMRMPPLGDHVSCVAKRRGEKQMSIAGNQNIADRVKTQSFILNTHFYITSMGNETVRGNVPASSYRPSNTMRPAILAVDPLLSVAGPWMRATGVQSARDGHTGIVEEHADLHRCATPPVALTTRGHLHAQFYQLSPGRGAFQCLR